MQREAIEFHDSVLARADRVGDQVRLFFQPAYAHRSDGEPARDAGTGWSVNAELRVYESPGCAARSNLPCDVWDGALRVGDLEFENVVPLPFDRTGAVHLTIELATGEVVKVSGTRVKLSVTGTYEFVENVSAG